MPCSLLMIRYLLSVGAYLVGAVPTGFLFAKYFFNIDLTAHGSGNIGATNCARVLGSKYYFLLIFALDVLKAYGYLWLAAILFTNVLPWYQYYFIAIALLIGNAYSPFLGFRGGKGVATTVGILAALAPVYFVVLFIFSWLLIVALVRVSAIASLGALMVTLLFSLSPYAMQVPGLVPFLGLLLLWSFVRHRDNILALTRG